MAEKELEVQFADSHTSLSSAQCPALCAVEPVSLDAVTPVRQPGALGGRGQHHLRHQRCLETLSVLSSNRQLCSHYSTGRLKGL